MFSVQLLGVESIKRALRAASIHSELVYVFGLKSYPNAAKMNVFLLIVTVVATTAAQAEGISDSWASPDRDNTGSRKCDGDSTKYACPAHRFGLTPECPALSCKHILSFNPWAKDGKYWVRSLGSEVLHPVFCDMSDGGWTLAFKIPSGIELDGHNSLNNPFEIWSSLAEFEDEEVSDPWRWRTDVDLKPYKNHFVRNWADLDIKKVKLVVVHNKQAVRTLWFDAKNTNRWDWFTRERLVRAWPRWFDLEKKSAGQFVNYVRVFGMNADLRKSGPKRSFMIQGPFGIQGCGEDEGWLLAVDARATDPSNSHVCAWEKRARGMHWLYSKLPTRARWSNESSSAVADGIMVFVW